MNTDPGYAVNADVTPTGGSMRTIPITLNSDFGGINTGNNSGKTVIPPSGGTGNGHAVEIDRQGNIYVAGSITNTTTGAKTFAVTKFFSNGTVDGGYGSGGTLTINFGAGDETAYDIELVAGDSPSTDDRPRAAGPWRRSAATTRPSNWTR